MRCIIEAKRFLVFKMKEAVSFFIALGIILGANIAFAKGPELSINPALHNYYLSSIQLHDDCKKALQIAAKNLQGFASSYCAAQIQGIVAGFSFASSNFTIPSDLESKEDYSTVCPPSDSVNPPKLREQRIAEDFILWFEKIQVSTEKDTQELIKAPGIGMLVLFYASHYACESKSVGVKK